ncbi:MAG: metallophosphoesterase family protein [Oligoflexia bacterium]|nr:metallophosphoesterase family protein [Oligoflexia bacterium]
MEYSRGSRVHRFKMIISLLGALLLGALIVTACIPPAAPGPFYYPRITLEGDASTSATIGWSTLEEPGPDQRLYFGTEDHGEDFARYPHSRSIDRANSVMGMNNAFVRLENLRPGTIYHFVIASPRNVSRRYFFRTSPGDESERLSIIAGGDSRTNRKPRQNANLLVGKLRPDFVLFGGDMTEDGGEAEWKQWLQDWQLTVPGDGRITPVVLARGNHERDDQILSDLFAVPPNAYYAVSAGRNLLRAYTLNSEFPIAGSQTEWLRAELAKDSGVTWKVAQYHRPMRPLIRKKPEGETMYRSWAPLFHQFGMDAVFESDAHTVKATWPLRPDTGPGSEDGFIRDDRAGTLYLGEGTWGAPLRKPDDLRGWVRNSDSFNHFNWLFVSSHEMEIRTINVDNAEEVEALTEAGRFGMPRKLRVWAPAHGDVIRLAR